MEKLCNFCVPPTTKDESEFFKSASSKDGLEFRCKVCYRAYRAARRALDRKAQQKYYKKNRKKIIKKVVDWQRVNARRRYDLAQPSRRKYKLKSLYGLALEDYLKLLEIQGNVCKICKLSPQKESLCVDHDHKTGAVRGLLCQRCNKAIGSFEDSPTLLKRAAAYIEECAVFKSL